MNNLIIRKIVLANIGPLTIRKDIATIQNIASGRGWKVITADTITDEALKKMGLSSDFLGDNAFVSMAVKAQSQLEEQIDEAIALSDRHAKENKILIIVVGGIPHHDTYAAYASYNGALDMIWETRLSAVTRYDAVLCRIDASGNQGEEQYEKIRKAWSEHPHYCEYGYTTELIEETSRILTDAEPDKSDS